MSSVTAGTCQFGGDAHARRVVVSRVAGTLRGQQSVLSYQRHADVDDAVVKEQRREVRWRADACA